LVYQFSIKHGNSFPQSVNFLSTNEF